MGQNSPLFSVALSALAQLIGFGLSLALSRSFAIPVWAVIGFHGIVSGIVAKFLRLPLPWVIMNLALWPAALGYHLLGLPNGALLVLALVLGLIYLPTFWTRVPFYPTSKAMYEEVLKQLPQSQGLNFMDLGCGYGSLLFFLARKRPDLHFIGVEIAPIPALFATLRAWVLRAPVKILWSSFWPVSLNEQDVVYAFLAPSPMTAVWEKAQKEMKGGSMLLINSFPLPTREQKKVAVADSRNCVLYTYRIVGHSKTTRD